MEQNENHVVYSPVLELSADFDGDLFWFDEHGEDWICDSHLRELFIGLPEIEGSRIRLTSWPFPLESYTWPVSFHRLHQQVLTQPVEAFLFDPFCGWLKDQKFVDQLFIGVQMVDSEPNPPRDLQILAKASPSSE